MHFKNFIIFQCTPTITVYYKRLLDAEYKQTLSVVKFRAIENLAAV